jgi:hypothetical protein
MNKSARTIVSLLFFLLISMDIYGQTSDRWHHPLYLANMGYWHSRIPVVVKNSSAQDIMGEAVRFTIGKGEGQLHLTGENASALRVTDSDGTELLCRITSPGGGLVTEGFIPDSSRFILPVTVMGGQSATFYIYYDNPAAWPVGAVLEEERYGRKDGKVSEISKGDKLHAEIKATQTISLTGNGRNEEWPGNEKWDISVPIKVFNFGKYKSGTLPVYVNMEQVYLRLHNKAVQHSPMQLGNKVTRSCFRFENALLFEGQLEALSEQTIYAYFNGNGKEEMQDRQKEFGEWLNDKRNLLRSFPATGEINRSGWIQDITIEPGKTYMFGTMVKCSDLSDGVSVQIRFTGKNDTVLNGRVASDKITGTSDWKFISGVFLAPEEASSARISLSLTEAGKAWSRGMIMMEVIEGYSSSMFFGQRDAYKSEELTVWPVNPVVKVFHEDLPPSKADPLHISAAKNEKEPLQIALRSSKDYSNIRVEVTKPVNSEGHKLDQVSVNIVGYVPIDYPSNYYEKKVPYWYLKFPTEPIGSDGWSGFWPDPLLPLKPFNLKANITQPLWIEVTVPEGASAGDYTGQIKIFMGETVVKQLPWRVHVRNFTLPEMNSFGALYDYRSVHRTPGSENELVRKDIPGNDLRNIYLSYMAKHRISSGEINPVPKVRYSDGAVAIDFKEYDKAATFYFDELKNPFAYLPTSLFYLFGWAFPPSDKFGEKPYPGDYPYADADRSKLRPEYKKAYQLVLKTFWDHLKEKGWADRCILYLSDEPHEADNNNGKSDDIRIQMKALCDMIHEVDPKIPVYVSTWWYRPEWEGYIDVWGLGFNGEGDYGHYVTAEDMQRITRSGGRIWYTTDGNFCTETPYMALERLLPWFGYKYGAEAYEFWGVNWLTYNPYKYGWHSYIFESQAPGEESWKRYPNGDGYIIYPGKPIGEDGLIGSIRLKQVREGAEDYEYLALLGNLIKKADQANPALQGARQALQQALDIVNIPCAMGRYSTKILKNPDEVLTVREQVAENIDKLINK